MFLSEIRRMPLLRVAIPFMVGITLALYLEVDLRLLGAGLLILGALFLVASRRNWAGKLRWIPGVALSAFLIVFGFAWQLACAPNEQPYHLDLEHQTGKLLVEVEKNYGTPKRSSKHLVRFFAEHDSTDVRPIDGKALVTLGLDSLHPVPQPGDRLLLLTYLKPVIRIPDPGGFDRRAWANHIDAIGEAYVNTDRWVTISSAAQGDGWAGSLRAMAAERLHSAGLRNNELALARALLLGERKELDPEQRDRFVQSGTIHVLAVSGLHVGLIFVILSWLTKFFGKGKNGSILRMAFTISGIWAYAWLTGMSPSVVRASIMFSLFALAGSLSRQTIHLNSLAAAAIIILLWDPGHISSPGFQLSFLAVLGIILFYRPIFGSLRGESRWVEPIWAVATVSIAAQVATAPLSIHAFGAFPIWFLPANVIVVSLVTVVVNLGVATLALSPVPFVSTFLAQELIALLGAVESISGFFARLPQAYLPMRVDLLQCLLLYAILAAFALLPWRKPFFRWVPAVLVISFFATWMVKANDQLDRTSLTVYDARDKAAFSLVTGRSMVVHAADPDQWMNRKVQQHAKAWGIEEVSWTTGSDPAGMDLTKNGLTVTAGLSVLSVQLSELQPNEAWNQVDVIILEGEGFVPDEIFNSICPMHAQFVIAPNVPWKSASFIRRKLEECGKKVHVIREQGAFIHSPEV